MLANHRGAAILPENARLVSKPGQSWEALMEKAHQLTAGQDMPADYFSFRHSKYSLMAQAMVRMVRTIMKAASQ